VRGLRRSSPRQIAFGKDFPCASHRGGSPSESRAICCCCIQRCKSYRTTIGVRIPLRPSSTIRGNLSSVRAGRRRRLGQRGGRHRTSREQRRQPSLGSSTSRRCGRAKRNQSSLFSSHLLYLHISPFSIPTVHTETKSRTHLPGPCPSRRAWVSTVPNALGFCMRQLLQRVAPHPPREMLRLPSPYRVQY
jgi:hypothetical protein